MTEQAERYDRIATGYARWWAPVLTPAVLELLDETAEHLAAGGHVLDLGTGTGQLAIEALTRWPDLSVVGIDASGEMRAMADGEATRRLPKTVREHFETLVAFADDLPFPDGTFDVALSSFVVQLVPNRARVLREVRRVLRPGATFAYVSWLQDDRIFEPDDVFDDLLDEFDIGDDGDDDPGRPGDLPSVDRAAGELRRAGFAGVSARASELIHPFTVDGYISFMVEFHEETLIAALDPGVRERFLAALAGRLAALTPQQMTMRFPIVFASGRRSA
jgi:ubiquinone/menaquinone biosynthesis C-methylase UbiE